MSQPLRILYYNAFLPLHMAEGIVSRHFLAAARQLDGWQLTPVPAAPANLTPSIPKKHQTRAARRTLRGYAKRLAPKAWRKKVRRLFSPISRYPLGPYLHRRKMLAKIEAAQQRGPYDLLLLHLAQGDLETLARLCRRTDKPVVLRAPGPFAYQADHVFNRYMSRRDRQNEQYLYQRADAILVISGDMKQMLVDDGIAADKIHVAPNGVDFSIFDNEQVDATAVRERYDLCERKVVGYVGGFWPGNDVTGLLRAWRVVEQREPEASLLLVGYGPQYAAAQQLSRELGLNHCVWSGRVSHSQVPAHIAAMDVGVGPYTAEAVTFVSPLKVIEYTAMGLPVVATRGGQISELIEEGVTGRIYDAGDAAQLAEGILALLADPAAARSMGRLARQRMERWFSWDKMARNVLAVCQHVAS